MVNASPITLVMVIPWMDEWCSKSLRTCKPKIHTKFQNVGATNVLLWLCTCFCHGYLLMSCLHWFRNAWNQPSHFFVVVISLVPDNCYVGMEGCVPDARQISYEAKDTFSFIIVPRPTPHPLSPGTYWEIDTDPVWARRQTGKRARLRVQIHYKTKNMTRSMTRYWKR